MLEFVTQAFDWLKDFSSSPWFYAIIFVIAVLDSVLPIVPSETLVIIGGVSAGLGNLWIPLVIVCAACGAFIGDNLSYLIGREASDWVMKRQTRTEKGAKRMAKIVEQVRTRRTVAHHRPFHSRWSNGSHFVVRSHTPTTTMVHGLGRYSGRHLGPLRRAARFCRRQVV